MGSLVEVDLVVFYYISVFEICPYMRGDLWW